MGVVQTAYVQAVRKEERLSVEFQSTLSRTQESWFQKGIE